ncbi:hypothetical protein NSK_003671 [Nannochloropsis salina CCMP1776]|uniref:Protein kinase domain-containing protein n=1 Tax=Nannochloropsis salina CCMP1776 TaxID=1027361 RepID=A0A4D9D9E2_9STRA|nr:hypothetical protein NSK_003671 [Nannochloropsis salina CCMP1776]|eukprot:TFJ85248.1 hypothetical protein NSK_003671 [Nannochloropsis salina CCMP1776]
MGNVGSVGSGSSNVLPISSTLVIAGHALRVKSCLGAGGTGTVYLAEDEARRKFAIKVNRVPKGDVAMNKAAEMELEQHARLPPHPHLITYIGSRIDHVSPAGGEGGASTGKGGFTLYYLLTEYCPNTAHVLLEGAERRKEPLAEWDVLNVFTSACAALVHLHAHGLAHRDVRVENLVLSTESNGQRVKLCGLGASTMETGPLRNSAEVEMAREDIERHTRLAYRSPEQVDLYSQQPVGVPVDVWALGVLLYRLCWWVTPFEDKAGMVLPMAILNGKYVVPPSLPIPGTNGQQSFPPYSPGLVTLLQCCLQPRPQDRATAAEVLEKVRELMASGEIGRHVDLPALGPLLPCPAPLPLGCSPSPSPSPSSASHPRKGGKKGRASGTGREERGPGEEDFLGLYDTATPPDKTALRASRPQVPPPTSLSSLEDMLGPPTRWPRTRPGEGGGGEEAGRLVHRDRGEGSRTSTLSGSLSASSSPSHLLGLERHGSVPGRCREGGEASKGLGSRSLSFVGMGQALSIWEEDERLRRRGWEECDPEQGKGGMEGSRRRGGGKTKGDMGPRRSNSSIGSGSSSLGLKAARQVWGLGRGTSVGGGEAVDPRGPGVEAKDDGMDLAELATSLDDDPSGRTPAKGALSALWHRRMRSIMGAKGETGRKSWVVKATSKEAGQPKAKYVRKLVLAVWEGGMPASTFFLVLSQRPVFTNPIVALKALITTLKVLQQGPRNFLATCTPCMGVLADMGRRWEEIGSRVARDPLEEQLPHAARAEGYTTLSTALTTPASTPASSGASGGSHALGVGYTAPPSQQHKRQHVDGASLNLLARLSRLLVQKLHFHKAHPAFAMHFTAIPTMLGYETVPVSGQEEDLQALTRLLTMQESLLQTTGFLFAVQNESVAVTARWARLPLIEEAYTIFVACTFLLASLLEISARASAGLPLPFLLPALPHERPKEMGATASSQGILPLTSSSSSDPDPPTLLHRSTGPEEAGSHSREKDRLRQDSAPLLPPVDWRERVSILLALREQYESQLQALRVFYRAAEEVVEVRNMKRMPILPVRDPVAFDGALCWKPLTMRSPMRGLGLLDRARMNEEGEKGRGRKGQGGDTRMPRSLGSDGEPVGGPPSLPSSLESTVFSDTTGLTKVRDTAPWPNAAPAAGGVAGAATPPPRQATPSPSPSTGVLPLPPANLTPLRRPSQATSPFSTAPMPSPPVLPTPLPPASLTAGGRKSRWRSDRQCKSRPNKSHYHSPNQNKSNKHSHHRNNYRPSKRPSRPKERKEVATKKERRVTTKGDHPIHYPPSSPLVQPPPQPPVLSASSLLSSSRLSSTLPLSVRGEAREGEEGKEQEVWFMPSSVTEEESLRRPLGTEGGAREGKGEERGEARGEDGKGRSGGREGRWVSGSGRRKSRGWWREEGEEVWIRSREGPEGDGEEGAGMPSGLPQGGPMKGLPPRLSMIEDVEGGRKGGRGGGREGGIDMSRRDLLSWSSSSSEEGEEEGEEGMASATNGGGFLRAAAFGSATASCLTGLGGGGGSTPILMGDREVEGEERRAEKMEVGAWDGFSGPVPGAGAKEGRPIQKEEDAESEGNRGELESLSWDQDKLLRARRREARTQAWRANLKPAVALALSSCLHAFHAHGPMIDLDEILWGEVIGHGAFATVYRATVQGQDVAVKKLVTQNNLPMAEKSLRDFESEVALLRELHHPNIIAFVGTCVDPVAVLTEFCHRGNLFMVVNEKGPPYTEIAWSRRLSIAKGLAAGMEYLHSRDPILIHRDLKSLNVLLNRAWVVKITDFGLSRFKPHSLTDIMTMQCGTYHWMAPEVINSTQYTEKADVYSFGIILWEIAARAIPYEGLQPVQVVAAVINRKERPKLPEDCPEDYKALVRSCWAQEPGDRPGFVEVVARLAAMGE